MLSETVDSLLSMLGGSHSFFIGNRTTCAQPIDIVRWLAEHRTDGSGALHIRNTILNAVIEAERACPGGGSIAILVSHAILNRSLGDAEVQDRIRALRQEGLDALRESRRRSSRDAFRTMSEFDALPGSMDLARQALELCSSNASITVLDSEAMERAPTRVEVVAGHRFPCHLPDVFLSASRIASRRPLVTPRVIIIDGMVERMSEIEGVSGGSYRSRTPLVLFARGYSDEVQNTLGVNYSTGHLVAVPLCVPFDELGANLLNDISIVCGADIVSSLKGELVSSRSWDSLEPVDRIDVTPRSASIVNDSSRLGVRAQRVRLREKRRSCAQPELPIIDRRLQCLTGDGVTVTLGGEHGDLTGLIRDRINDHVRIFRSIGNKGTISLNRLSGLRSLSHIAESLLPRHSEMPSQAFVSGIRSGISCALSLSRTGGIVIHDREC